MFNNVTVYGHTLKTDLIRENQQTRINERFQQDHNGMQEWAARNDWSTFPGANNMMLYRCDVYGDHWMALNVRLSGTNAGELCMVLNGDGKDPASGYRAVVKQENGKFLYTLYRDTAPLATKTGPALTSATDYSFRLLHMGQKIWLELDGEEVLAASDAQPLPGHSPAYRADGCFALARDLLVLGRNMLDYSFAEAPVDWIAQGTWMESTRWACAPQWSFLAGWSRGDAVLWHKQRIIGDQSFEAFVGLKMEYPRERDIYDNRYRNFSITICGDGLDPLSGYAGIYGAPDATGKVPNQRAVLLRNGVEVAATTLAFPGARHRTATGLKWNCAKKGVRWNSGWRGNRC